MIIVQREDSQVVEKDIPGLYMIYISKRMEKEFTVAGFSKKKKSGASSQEDTSQILVKLARLVRLALKVTPPSLASVLYLSTLTRTQLCHMTEILRFFSIFKSQPLESWPEACTVISQLSLILLSKKISKSGICLLKCDDE